MINKGWRKVKLGDVCESIQAGLIRRANEVNIPEANIPYIKMDCLGNSTNLILKNIVNIKASKDEIKKYNLMDKDILFNVRNSLELVGKVAIYRSIYPITLYNHMLVRLRLNQLIIYPDFIIQYFISKEFKKEIELLKKGTTSVAAIYQNDIENLQIPLPSLDEQKQIAKDLDYRLTEVDKAKQSTLEQLEAADALWKAYLREAFQDDGKWEKVKLGEVCEIMRGRFSHRPRNEPKFFNGVYPFIQTGDVVSSGGGKVSYSQTLNELGLKQSKFFEPILVLITIAANIGYTGILDYPACFTDSVVGLKCNENILNLYFLELYLRFKRESIENMATQVAQKNLNNEILKTVIIPLPPLEEQKRIAHDLQEKLAQLETLKQKLKDQLSMVEVLPQAYLREAFGEDEKD